MKRKMFSFCSFLWQKANKESAWQSSLARESHNLIKKRRFSSTSQLDAIQMLKECEGTSIVDLSMPCILWLRNMNVGRLESLLQY